MSMVLNGSAYAFIADNLLGATDGLSYPILFGGWVKIPDNGGNQHAISASDNASASPDYASLAVEWGTVSDPTLVRTSAAGSVSNTGPQITNHPNGTWVFIAHYAVSSAERYTYRGTTASAGGTNNRAPTGLSHTTLGGVLQDSAIVAPVTGRLAEMFTAHSFDPGNITAIIADLAAGVRPPDCPELAAFLTGYWSGVEGFGEADEIAVLTNSGITFDGADHPIVYDPPENTVAPALTGDPDEAAPLAVTDGTWTGTPTITYQVQKSASATFASGVSSVAGATSNTYDIAHDGTLVGLYLRYEVTGTNAAGSEIAYSNIIGPIAAAVTLRHDDLLGAIPLVNTVEFAQWQRSLVTQRTAPLYNSGLLRTNRVFIDNVLGDDSNDGLTSIEPIATMAAAQLLAGPDTEFLFRCGREYREFGSETVWDGSDNDGPAALYLPDRKTTVRLYGIDDGTPTLFVCGNLQIPLGATFAQADSPNDDCWAYDDTPFGAEIVDAVYDESDYFNPLAYTDSLAACQALPWSFFHDSGNDLLYINTDGSNPNTLSFTCIPRNVRSCFRREGRDSILFLPGAIGIGWAKTILDPNPHQGFDLVGMSDTKSCISAGYTVIGGPTHASSNWQPGGFGGGITTLVDLRFGICYPSSGVKRGWNFYQPEGGDELVAVRCSAPWPATDGELCDTIHGHTGGTDHSLFLAYDCNGRISCGNLPVADPTGDFAECRGFNIQCTHGSEEEPIHLDPAMANFYHTGGQYWLTPETTDTFVSNIACQSIFHACVIGLKNTVTTGSTAVGMCVNAGGSDYPDFTARFPHCMWVIDNVETNTRGLGFHFNVISATGEVATSALVFRSILYGKRGLCLPGIGDADANQIENAYFGMDEDGTAARPYGGYASVTTGIELTQAPDQNGHNILAELVQVITAENPDIWEYDARFYLRNTAEGAFNTLGPWEHDSVRGENIFPTTLIGGDLVNAQLVNRQLVGMPLVGFGKPRRR